MPSVDPKPDPDLITESVRDPEPIDESVEDPSTGDSNLVGQLNRRSDMALLEGIKVTVYRKEGTGDDISWSYVTSTSTDAAGEYELTGLDAGTYHLKFSDADGVHLTEYFDGKTTLDLGTDIEVEAATTVAGKDAVLGTASKITGTVSDA